MHMILALLTPNSFAICSRISLVSASMAGDNARIFSLSLVSFSFARIWRLLGHCTTTLRYALATKMEKD